MSGSTAGMELDQIADALLKAAIIFGIVAAFGVSIAADVTLAQAKRTQRTRGQRRRD